MKGKHAMRHATTTVLAASIVLLLPLARTAGAQRPQSRSHTSVVQRLAGDSVRPATGNMRELRCRGKQGIDLRVHRDPVPGQPGMVTMALRYDRVKAIPSLSTSSTGMGLIDNGMTYLFIPGACNWGSGYIPQIPGEPGVVYFDLPRDAQANIQPGSRDTSVTAAALFPDPTSFPRYLGDSTRWWVFYVDDVSNVSISSRAWGETARVAVPSSNVAGALRDAPAGSTTLSSARVLPGDGSGTITTVPRTPAPTPTPAPAPSPTGNVGGALRDKPAAAAVAAGSRTLPTDSAARRTATVRTPTTTPTNGVEGPLRDPSPGTATGARALPTDTAARRSATVRTPVTAPTPTAGPLRGKSPGGAQPSTSRATSKDTAAKIPDDARVSAPQLRVNRIYDVRTVPGPKGVTLTFQAKGAGGTSEFRGISIPNQTAGLNVQFSRTRPSWDARERLWVFASGQAGWSGSVEVGRNGGFEAEPSTTLDHGELYYFLITVYGSDPSARPGQWTGSFRADVRTPIGDLFKK